MNKLEKILSGWNFKKIAVWYLILAAAAGLACVGTVGFIYRERLNFAWQYSRLEEAKDDAALKAAADKTAAASADVVDVLILDEADNVTYSAKNSEFADGAPGLVSAGGEKKYLEEGYKTYRLSYCAAGRAAVCSGVLLPRRTDRRRNYSHLGMSVRYAAKGVGFAYQHRSCGRRDSTLREKCACAGFTLTGKSCSL